MSLPSLTLILGGAASGKSQFAENLVMNTDRPRVYLATSQAWDQEMEAKIAAHRTQRGPDWTTIEEPLNIGPSLSRVTPDQVVLLDCVTLWLTNWMCDSRDMDTAIDGFMGALSCPAPLIIVSNDLGGGLIPMDADSRQFQRIHGKLNQAIAARADLVVNVIAGLPQVLKGTLP